MTPLAHGGGIPEALTVLVPMALVVMLLRMGAKKAPPEPDPSAAAPEPAPEDQQET